VAAHGTKYRPEVDGLRALAVLPVILFHADLRPFAGGYVGVDVFFVISGYLITSLIVAQMQAGEFTLAGFYERRIRRILPALFLVMVACLPFAWLWMVPSDLKEFCRSLIAVVVFASNLLFWREGGYFDSPGALKPLLHTWTLAVEEQYYVLFPLLLMGLWRLGRLRLAAVFAALGLGSFAVAQWAVALHPKAAFYLLPTRGWELLLGALSAPFFTGAAIVAPRGTTRALREIGGFLGLALIAAAVFSFDSDLPYPGVYALVPTLGTVLVILCASEHTLAGRFLSSSALVGLGLISYSAYLWHQPIFAFARLRAHGDLPMPWLLSAAAVALACVSWRFVEKPYRDRGRIARSTVFMMAGALSGLLLLIGLAGVGTNGFDYRFSKEDRALAAPDADAEWAYVEERFKALELKPFDDSGRTKLLIIGDSFAEDLVNALYEGGLAGQLQISTHWIPTRCGNLYLEEGIAARVPAKRQQECQSSGRYQGAALHRLLSQADMIWLASDWASWEVQLMPQSLSALRHDVPGSVFVFGPKDFGPINTPLLLRLTLPERVAYRSPIRASKLEVAAAMRSALGADQFVDVSPLLCHSSSTCPQFTPGGELISFDGFHLTRAGARYYCESLAVWLRGRGFDPAC
jgi:peptidoglycan/LPS O-acetylase OafA/YrhL